MKTGTQKLTWLCLLVLMTALLSGNGAVTLAASQPDLPSAPVKMGSAAPAAALPGPKTFDLCASDGSLTMPDGAVVPIWGFVATASCGPGLVTALPGPELRAVAGDSVTINLANALAVPTSILIPGQALTASGGAPGAFTVEAAPGGAVTYTFTAAGPGPFLYESGTDAERQVAMGLYGALVVESGVAGQAYGPESAFDAEAVLVMSEIDPTLNADPYAFDMLNYKPLYWLLGGKAYPDTALIPAPAGGRLLLRYLNAGFTNLSMSLMGAHQQLVARESYPLAAPYLAVAETVPAGQTMDAIVSIPLDQPVGSRLAVFNRNLYVTNGAGYPGGMLAFIEVGAAPPPPPPPSFGVSVAPASAAASGAPGSSITYTLDVTNTGTASDSYTVTVSGNAWTTTAPTSVGPLAAGATAPVSVSVLVPAGAADGDSDLATITFTSVGDGAQSASASLTTTAQAAPPPPPPVYGVSIAPASDGQSAPAGDTTTYALTVTNTGDTSDSFTITVSGNAWTTTAPASVGPLAAGASAPLSVDVSIPAGAANGDSDLATITVTSQGDAAQFATSTLTTTAFVQPVSQVLYFSTASNQAVPGVAGPYDDADIYAWDGAAFSRVFDGSAAGLPGNTDIDALQVVDLDTFYVSFNRDGGTSVPGLGNVPDEDIVLYDAGAWSLYFDGSAVGLNEDGEDVDAFGFLPDGSLVISTLGNVNPAPDLPGTHQDEDMLRCVPTGLPVTSCAWSFYFDGSDVGLANNNGEDVDGLAISGSDIYISTLGNFAVTGLSGEGRDVFVCSTATTGEATACTGFSLFFDGSAVGLTDLIDALDVP